MSGSFPTYEDTIYDAIAPILQRVCGVTLVFDGPPQYEVPEASYPFAVMEFVETDFSMFSRRSVPKAGREQEQIYSLRLWCIRKVVEEEDLWKNIRQRGAAVKVALEADHTLGGLVTFTEVVKYATDNEVTERMLNPPSDTCGVRVDVQVTCMVSSY